MSQPVIPRAFRQRNRFSPDKGEGDSSGAKRAVRNDRLGLFCLKHSSPRSPRLRLKEPSDKAAKRRSRVAWGGSPRLRAPMTTSAEGAAESLCRPFGACRVCAFRFLGLPPQATLGSAFGAKESDFIGGLFICVHLCLSVADFPPPPNVSPFPKNREAVCRGLSQKIFQQAFQRGNAPEMGETVKNCALNVAVCLVMSWFVAVCRGF